MYRDIILSIAVITPATIGAVSVEEISFWERIAEKWGIGFIGLGLFCVLAWFTHKREIALQEERDKREAEDKKERVALATRNNELQQEQLELLHKHASRLECLVKEGNKGADQHAAAMRMVVRKLRRPCALPFEPEDLAEHGNFNIDEV